MKQSQKRTLKPLFEQRYHQKTMNMEAFLTMNWEYKPIASILPTTLLNPSEIEQKSVAKRRGNKSKSWTMRTHQKKLFEKT